MSCCDGGLHVRQCWCSEGVVGLVSSSSRVVHTKTWDGQLLHLLDVTARGVLLLTGDSLATRRRGSLFQEGRAEWQYPAGSGVGRVGPSPRGSGAAFLVSIKIIAEALQDRISTKLIQPNK